MGGVLSLQLKHKTKIKKDRNKIKHNYLNLYGVGGVRGVPNYQDQDACRPGVRGCLEAPHPVTGYQAGCEVGDEAVTWSACCMLGTGTWRQHTRDNMEDTVEDGDDDGGGGDDDCDNLGNQTLHNTQYTRLKQCIISQNS